MTGCGARRGFHEGNGQKREGHAGGEPGGDIAELALRRDAEAVVAGMAQNDGADLPAPGPGETAEPPMEGDGGEPAQQGGGLGEQGGFELRPTLIQAEDQAGGAPGGAEDLGEEALRGFLDHRAEDDGHHDDGEDGADHAAGEFGQCQGLDDDREGDGEEAGEEGADHG